MAEKDLLIKEKLEHTGIFNFEDAYSYAFLWFKDEGYGLIEERYIEKVTGNARDVSFEWKATKQVSDYFKIEISVKTDVQGLIEVEVEQEGSKIKSNKGRITIELRGALVKDPESKWDGSPFTRFLRETYNKFIIASRVDALEGTAIEDVQDFKEKMKEFFVLSGKR